MAGVGIGLRLVPVGLARLGEQDQWSGIRRLRREREVEQN